MAANSARFNAKRIPGLRSSFNRYILSDAGQNTVRGAGVFVSACPLVGYLFANSWLMDYYRDVIQFYKHGLPVNVDEKLRNRANAVLGDFNMRSKYEKAFEYFIVNSFTPRIIGSLATKHGVFLGLPKIYEYDKSEDIEIPQITVDFKPVPWGSNDGQLLKESLILSEKAQKFAIAQQIAYADSHYIYVKGLLGSAACLGYQILSIHANRVFLGYQKSRSYRFLLYSGTGAICLTVWSMVLDAYNKYLEKYMDDTAAKLGLDYALGGVEFFTQVIKGNIALRGLLSSGESMYTVEGNNNSWIRSKTIPLTKRKHHLELWVQRYLSSQNTNGGNNNNNISNDDSSKASAKENIDVDVTGSESKDASIDVSQKNEQ